MSTPPTGVFSAVTDFYVLSIPISMVIGLKLSLKKRIGVASIFLSGLMACGLSIAGAVYRFKDELASQSDYSWDGIYIQSFGLVELTIGVICCCLPVTVIIYKAIFKNSKSAWVSLRGYFIPQRKTTSNSSAEGGHKDLEGGISPKELPQVPKRTFSGLKSIVRKGPRSQQRITQMVETDGDAYFELQSVDYDYHRHIHRN